MKKTELLEFLQRQNEFLQGRLDEALASVNSLTLANEKLVATVDELRRQIASLEDVIKGKGAELRKEKAARQAVQRLQGSPSERQAKTVPTPATSETQQPEKKRTNNGAKRKTHPECEVETVVVEPDSPDFNPEEATFIASVMSCATSWSNALQEDFLQGTQIRAGRENIQRYGSCHAAAQLAVHFFLYSRTR